MNDSWAARFDENRARLRQAAFRMLGSHGEAEDAVQEAWLRVAKTDVGAIEHFEGWLTTVVSRVCLDMLRQRKTRREDELDEATMEATPDEAAADPEREAALADALGPALLVVLETLPPAERVAFVLHDLFDLSFDEIGGIVGRTAVASRQLASRARRKIKGQAAQGQAGAERQREIVAAFFAASRAGNMAGLLAILDPGVVFRADEVAVKTAEANKGRGAPQLAAEIKGAEAVARTLKGAAMGAQMALIDGTAGAVWAPGGKTVSAFTFVVRDDKIVAIALVMERSRVTNMDVVLLS